MKSYAYVNKQTYINIIFFDWKNKGSYLAIIKIAKSCEIKQFLFRIITMYNAIYIFIASL